MTRVHTGNAALDESSRRLVKALRTLLGTHDRPIARRSARRRSLTALRLVRAAMDREFPAIKKSREGVKRLTPEGRIARMKRKGYSEVSRTLAGEYAAVGIPIKRIVWTTKEMFQSGIKDGVPQYRTHVERHEELFVPGWAWAIAGTTPTLPKCSGRLRAAKKSRKTQQAALTVATLRDQEPSE